MTSLANALRRAAAHHDARLARALAPFGVTPAEWQVLEALYAEGAVSPSVLGVRIGVTRGAVTRLVERLRVKALAVRASGRGDARFQTVALTGAAARLVPQLAAVARGCEAEVFVGLSTKVREQLAAALATVGKPRD